MLESATAESKSDAAPSGACPAAEAAERRVEGRRAGGMDDEDLLLKTAGAQGVSKTSKSSKKPEQGHLLLVVSLFETYSQPTADSGQERINPLLTASSFEL